MERLYTTKEKSICSGVIEQIKVSYKAKRTTAKEGSMKLDKGRPKSNLPTNLDEVHLSKLKPYDNP